MTLRTLIFNKISSMFQDSPINNSEKDKLNRGRFVRAVVEEIKAINTLSSFTVGLYGKWGTGKTSLINLFREQLDKDGYFTTYFNPWRFKSEEIIIHELFLKILEGIQSDKKLTSKLKRLGDVLEDYSKYIFFNDAAKNITEAAGKFLRKEKTLEGKKDEINKILGELANPLIIFIDDIDRLDNSEIQQIFKILKLTVDFNNLIYVLAFDEEMVAKSLSEVYGNNQSDGLRFIEKIIQLPLRIPRTSEGERFQYTLDLLEDWIERKKLGAYFEGNKDNIGEFLESYGPLHDLVVKTPRDSKRLINSISFVEACLRDEVNVLDLFFIETIRIFLPQVFDLILEDNFILFSKPSYANTSPNKGRSSNKQATSYIEKLEEYGLIDSVSIIALEFLFPLNDLFHRNVLRDPEDYKLHFQDQRLGVRDYFYRYLEFKLDTTQITDKDFKQILSKINIEKEYSNIKEDIQELCRYSSDNILRRLLLNINHLTNNGKKNVVKLLATEKHFLSGQGLDNVLLQNNIRFPIKVLKEFETGDDVNDTLNFIMRHNENIYYVADFIRHTRRLLKTSEGTSVFEKEINKIENDFIDKILLTDIIQFFNNAQDGKNIVVFGYFEQNNKLRHLKNEILKYLKQDMSNVYTFLKTLINPTYALLTKKKTYTEIKYENFERIEKYIDRKHLIASLKETNMDYADRALYDGRDLSGLSEQEQIAVQYFRYVSKEKQKILLLDS